VAPGVGPPQYLDAGVRSWFGNEWHDTWDLAEPGAAQPGAVTACSRVADQVDVFWVAPNGAVRVRS